MTSFGLGITGTGNRLPHTQQQAITEMSAGSSLIQLMACRLFFIWTNVGVLSIWHSGTIFNGVLIEMETFLLMKMHLKSSSGDRYAQTMIYQPNDAGRHHPQSHLCFVYNFFSCQSPHTMTSWYGAIFRVAGPLYGETTDHRWACNGCFDELFDVRLKRFKKLCSCNVTLWCLFDYQMA